MSWGTALTWAADGKLLAIDSPLGAPQLRCRWGAKGCEETAVWLASGASLTLRPLAAPHPLLGAALGVYSGDAYLTEMGAVTWERLPAAPLFVPAVMNPQTLPPGTGTALLNAIAQLAAARGDATLRYRGPYPTAALYHALQTCFAVDQTEDEFCKDALQWAADGLVREHAAQLTPSPLAWWMSENRAVVWAREMGPLVAVQLDGVRLPVTEAGEAHVMLGAMSWCVAAHVTGATARDIAVTRRLLRACQSDAVGKQFPAALVAALTELVADAMPPPLRVAAAQVGKTLTLRWEDLGMVTCRDGGDVGLSIHAGIWELYRDQGMAAVLRAVLEVVMPHWQRRAAAVLAKAAT